MQEIPYQPSSMSPQTVMLTKALWHERQVNVQLMCPSCKIHMEKKGRTNCCLLQTGED